MSKICTKIYRRQPLYINDKAEGGLLETRIGEIEDSYVQKRWGGGIYQLSRFEQLDGIWRFVSARKIFLDGPSIPWSVL